MKNKPNHSQKLPEIKTKTPVPRRIGTSKAILFGTIACLLCVLAVFTALELTFRSIYERAESLDWLRFHPTRLYINNPDRPKVYWNTEWNVNSQGLRGPELGPKSKPRIYCLGDSSTFGYRASYAECYPGRLNRLLKEYETINGGTFGYTSFQGLKQFEELKPQIKPDIVTIAFGFNDRRYVVRPDLIDSEETFTTLYQRYSLHMFLSHSRFYQVLMHTRMENRLRKHPPITTLVPRVDTLQYRKNIETIITQCQKENIKVILIGIGDHPEMFRIVNEGALALEKGEREKAIVLFQRVREGRFSEDAQVIATYLQTIALQAMGNFEEADARQFDYPHYYHFPGVNPIRTAHSYFRALKELGKTYDLPVIFYLDLIKDDPKYYIDECHPSIEGYRILAETIAETIKSYD